MLLKRQPSWCFVVSPLLLAALTLDFVAMTANAVLEKSTQFLGGDAVLNCPSLPQANIWMKGGRVLSIDRSLIGHNDANKYIPNPHLGPRKNSTVAHGFDLVIRAVKFDDAGIYGCQWNTFSKKLNLVVVSQPKCSSIRPTYKEGESVVLTCDVTSNGDYETEVDWIQIQEGVEGGMKLRMICTDNHPLRVPNVKWNGQGKGSGQGNPAPRPAIQPVAGGTTKTFTINSKCTIRALRSYHHDSQFLCRIRRKDLKPDLIDDARADASSCTPGVFNVHFKPQFRCPSEQEFEGDEPLVNVFCDIIANPFSDDDVKMHWKFNGRPVSPRNISAYEIPHGRRSKVVLANGADLDEKIITLVVFRESHIEEKTIEKRIVLKRRKVAYMDWKWIAGIAGGVAAALLIFVYCLWRCKQKDDDYDSEADEKEKEMEMIPRRRQQLQQPQPQQPQQFHQQHHTINNNRKFQMDAHDQPDGFYDDEVKWRLHQDFDSGFGQPVNEIVDEKAPFKLEKKLSLDRQSTPSFMYRVEPLGSDSCSTYQDSIPSTSTFLPNGGGSGSGGGGRTIPSKTPPPQPNGGFSITRPAPAAPAAAAAPRIPSTASAFTPAAAAASVTPVRQLELQQQQPQQQQQKPQQQSAPPPPPPKPRPRPPFRPSVSPSLCDTPPSAPSSPQSSMGAAAAATPFPHEPSDGEAVPQPQTAPPPPLTMTMPTTTSSKAAPTPGSASTKSKYNRSHSYTKSMGRNDVRV